MWLLAAFLSSGCAAGSGAGAEPAATREETFSCEGAGAPIGASIFWPTKGTVSLPTAIVVVGAQRWDRYGDLPDKAWGHYRDIAQALAARGAAAVLFDKGGTGVTGGPPASFDRRVDELTQVVACARARPEVGPLTLVGHSQGASVALAQARRDAPAALVLLSPAAGGGDLPEGVPVTVIQAAAEATPALRPILIPNANHLLMIEPAVAGTTHVAPEALQVITDAVLATHR